MGSKAPSKRPAEGYDCDTKQMNVVLWSPEGKENNNLEMPADVTSMRHTTTPVGGFRLHPTPNTDGAVMCPQEAAFDGRERALLEQRDAARRFRTTLQGRFDMVAMGGGGGGGGEGQGGEDGLLDAPSPEPDNESVDRNCDECDVCGDGGELICCDVCDKAYHAPCIHVYDASALPEPWQCPACVPAPSDEEATESTEDEPTSAQFYVDEEQEDEEDDSDYEDVPLAEDDQVAANMWLETMLLSTPLLSREARPQPILSCLNSIKASMVAVHLMQFAQSCWDRLPRFVQKGYRLLNPAHYTIVFVTSDLEEAGYDTDDESLRNINITELHGKVVPLLKCRTKNWGDMSAYKRCGGGDYSVLTSDTLTPMRNRVLVMYRWVPSAKLPRFDAIETVEDIDEEEGARRLADAKALAEARWRVQHRAGGYLIYNADGTALLKFCEVIQGTENDLWSAADGETGQLTVDTIDAAGLDGLKWRNLATDKSHPKRPAMLIKSAALFTPQQLEDEMRRIEADGDERLAELRREATLAGCLRRGRFPGSWEVRNAQGVCERQFAEGQFIQALKLSASKGGVRRQYDVGYLGLRNSDVNISQKGRSGKIALTAAMVVRATKEKTDWCTAFVHGWYDEKNERYLVYIPGDGDDDGEE